MAVSDTEALLMQGIQWRVLDLRFRPDRLSSWKGLAQVSVVGRSLGTVRLRLLHRKEFSFFFVA